MLLTSLIISTPIRVAIECSDPVPFIHQLNTTTRMPFEILFVMLIEAIVSPFALGVQCLHENEKTAKCPSSCIQLT